MILRGSDVAKLIDLDCLDELCEVVCQSEPSGPLEDLRDEFANDPALAECSVVNHGLPFEQRHWRWIRTGRVGAATVELLRSLGGRNEDVFVGMDFLTDEFPGPVEWLVHDPYWGLWYYARG